MAANDPGFSTGRPAGPVWSYGRDPNDYRDMLQMMERTRAMSATDIDVAAMLEEGRTERHEAEIGQQVLGREQQQSQFTSDLGLRTRQVGLAEEEWGKRSEQYDVELEMRQQQIKMAELEYEQAEKESTLYAKFYDSLSGLISSGNFDSNKLNQRFEGAVPRGISPYANI